MTDWTSAVDWERDIMLKNLKRSRSFSLRCWMSTMGLFIFSLFFYIKRFVKQVHAPHRFLAYRIDRIQKTPFYEIVFGCQMCSGAYVIFTNSAIDNLVSILVLHISSQLVKMRIVLNNLVDALVNESISPLEFKKGLAAIVTRHEELMR